MSGFLDIFKAISSRFNTAVKPSLPAGTQVHHDNDPADPSANGTAVHVHIHIDDSNQTSSPAPTRRFRNTGTLICQVFTDVRKGDKQALQIVDTISGAFRGVTVDGITYGAPYPSVVGETRGRWQINVICPFYSDILS